MSDAAYLTWQQHETLKDLACRITCVQVEQDTGWAIVSDNGVEMAVLSPSGHLIRGYEFGDGSTVHPSIEGNQHNVRHPIPSGQVAPHQRQLPTDVVDRR